MGSLSNLYISQSYTSLAHLGTDNALVPGQMTILQDGIGQSLNISFDGTNISSSGNIYAANITQSVFETGSFATTGSNVFVGPNVFSSSVDILGGLNLYQNGIYMGLPKQMGDPYDTNIVISTPRIVGQSGSGNRLILTGDTMTSKGVTILNGLGITGSVVISPLPGMTPTGGDLDVYGTFTASLQEGYVWIGNSSGKTITVATSSFATLVNTGSLLTTASFNQYTQSTNIRLNNLETTTASLNTSVSELNSWSASAKVSISALNTYTASQSTASIITSISNLNQFTASQITQNATLGQVTSSILSFTASTNVSIANINTATQSLQSFTQSANIRLNNLETTTASLNVSIANINNATQSLQGQLTTIGLQSGSWITESETGSFLITASAVSNILTFTKGDNTQFNLTVGTDINTGSYLTTASFNAYTSSNNQRVSSLESNSASVNISIAALNVFTASQSTASIVNSINELNTFSASAKISISNLNTATASLFTSTSLSLITASFNTSSRNLTFTKGDNSTFSLNIPDITGSASTDTGSLLLNAQANGVNTIQFTRGDNTNFNVVLTVSSSAAAPQNTYTAIYSGSTWNVTHNLNTSTPLVFAYESGSQYTLPATLDVINPNQITLTWSRVVNGSLIVVNGGGGTSTYYGDVNNATTASFTHNLDTLYPLVQFYESGSNAQAIPAGIVSTDVNTTTLYFSNPVNGKVVIKK